MRLLLLTVLVCVASSCTPRECTSDDQCDDGFFCQPSADDPQQRVCARACAADLRCPAGQACVTRDDGSREGVCLLVEDDAGIGEPCADDRSCASGACLGGDAPVCVDICDPFGAACGNGDRCTLDGLRYVCVPPLADKPAGDACVSPRECESGTCVVHPDP